jgi:hypothetical protein
MLPTRNIVLQKKKNRNVQEMLLPEQCSWQLATMIISIRTPLFFYYSTYKEGKAPSGEKDIKGRDVPADTY